MSNIPPTSMRLLLSEDVRMRQSGMALVIVLSMVVLLSALVTGLLMRAGSDHTAAASYRSTASARQLADTTVNLVQGQINEATSQGSTFAWASQPGALRVYNNSGNLNKIYRLYSAAALTATQASALASDLPPANWATLRSQWVDLNAPVISGNSIATISYPILDPRAITNMDGFKITGAPTTATQSAPMPVRWLYVLQNGQIVSPTVNSATLVTVAGASGANPIVGRIAFWTDDETCKVNINTAAGDGIANGADYSDIANKTFWDTPRFAAVDEWNLGGAQPYVQEYQRYPGHPGTVALNNILHGLGLLASSASSDFYSLTPRYTYGGSKGATQPYNSSATAVPMTSSRFYTSVSEMLFDPSRNPSTVNTSTASRGCVETARFFLTTHSRAPEVNLFGKPRISMWPISSSDDTNHRTPADQLLAFDSTVGGNPYYFQRQDSKSATTDVLIQRNQDLLTYLDGLTQTNIPGFGGNFAGKYPQPGMHQILTEMFDYVRITNMKDVNLPGESIGVYPPTNPNWYAAGFASGGWLFGQAQVTPTVCNAWNTRGFGCFPRISEVALQFVCLGQGKLTQATVPAQTVTAATPISATELGSLSGTVVFSGITTTGSLAGVVADDNKAVQAFVLLNFTSPVQMMSPASCYFWVSIDGLQNFALNGTALQFPTNQLANVSANMGGDLGGNHCTGSLGFVVMMGAGGAQKALRQTADDGHYPYYSAVIPISVTGANTMAFTGGVLTLSIYGPGANDATKGDLIQTLQVTVPDATFPAPSLATHRVIGTGTAPDSTNSSTAYSTPSAPDVYDRWRWPRIQNTENPKGGNFLIEPTQDVVESMVLNSANGWSDARMLAARNIPASSNAFTPHPLWGQRMAHNSFYWSACTHPGNTQLGSLVNNAQYAVDPAGDPKFYPRVPPNMTSATLSASLPGDWDNGIGSAYVDGPWINKSDEGCTPDSTGVPYFEPTTAAHNLPQGFFSPNRQIPSPVMFGSLPTGVDVTGNNPKPWQTLLFRPAPGHPGLGTPQNGPPYTQPPDHLLLDLFWMPVAEPYAISEPFSSAGKINLNYQIVPFTYIKRSTGIRAVLASEKVARVAKSDAPKYRCNGAYSTGVLLQTPTRYALKMDETLSQFEDRFNGTGAYTTPDIFRSPTQICDLYLVPNNYSTLAQFQNEWYGDKFAMVGDNVREKPYANIYGRITTKSNTFTVYCTVQVLKNPPATPSQWDENNGAIMGEYRGSTTLERFIDPNVSIADYATNTTADTLESYYRWRVVENHQFAP